ncbi:hypothetical protein [Vibrio penaeicida]|uniref:Uncharacterized protein n=1 Tax=Vibrio penaeicida TaxID=104609 RepID=A0AAV5NS96_9VIBR|nr:hypothetical protein [Vibrio penaeicida]RTZ18704.1 hypothetical protein EKN09_29255 [Vibrio penaeicida]GLQ73496.1 hypothetical protein GCM10007932_28560 [Vibrio penaeicida]
MLKKICTVMAVVFSINISAANISGTSTISKLYTYGENTKHNNRIVIVVDSPSAGCDDGYWLDSSDNLGNKNIAAFLLSAFHANSKVYFAAYTDQLWTGSSGKFCKIHSVGLER